MSRSRINSREPLSPLAMLIASAAARHTSRRGADVQRAIVELAQVARLSVLEHGIVASDDVRTAIDTVATRYLGRAAADRELTRSCGKVSDPQVRNAIEVAHGQVLELSETAHYYAGVMSGLTLVELSKNRR